MTTFSSNHLVLRNIFCKFVCKQGCMGRWCALSSNDCCFFVVWVACVVWVALVILYLSQFRVTAVTLWHWAEEKSTKLLCCGSLLANHNINVMNRAVKRYFFFNKDFLLWEIFLLRYTLLHGLELMCTVSVKLLTAVQRLTLCQWDSTCGSSNIFSFMIQTICLHFSFKLFNIFQLY